MSTLRQDIEQAINRHAAENGSNTPDFILADYLLSCLCAFEHAIVSRETWHGRGAPDSPAPRAPERETTYFCTLCGRENLHGPTCPYCLLRYHHEAAAADQHERAGGRAMIETIVKVIHRIPRTDGNVWGDFNAAICVLFREKPTKPPLTIWQADATNSLYFLVAPGKSQPPKMIFREEWLSLCETIVADNVQPL